LKDRIDFDSRGLIDIKGKGATASFLVRSCKLPLLPSAVPYAVDALNQRRRLEPRRTDLVNVVDRESCVPFADAPASLVAAD
jgi:hypothetical protein